MANLKGFAVLAALLALISLSSQYLSDKSSFWQLWGGRNGRAKLFEAVSSGNVSLVQIELARGTFLGVVDSVGVFPLIE